MATEAPIRYGEIKFIEQCSRCHVFGPSVTSDLRKLPLEAHDLFRDIVLNGPLASRGMERFGDVLSEADFDGRKLPARCQQEGATAICSGAKPKSENAKRRIPRHQNMNWHGSMKINRGFTALFS